MATLELKQNLRKDWRIEMSRHFIRRNLKKVPPLVSMVRAARSLRRSYRTRRLLANCPEGGFLNCNGLSVFCDFRKESYAWYDGPSANLSAEQQVIEMLFEQNEGDVFIDIGAHFGYFSAFAAGMDCVAKTLALEPDRDNFQCLQRTMAALPNSQVVLLQQAVSDRDGEVALYATDAPCLHTYPEEGSRLAYQIPCTSLDSLVSMHCKDGDKVAVIKIDVDGAEPLMFGGGDNTIREHRPIIFMEFAPLALEASGVVPQHFYSELCDRFHVYWCDGPSPQLPKVSSADFDRIEATVRDRVTNLVLSSSPLHFHVKETRNGVSHASPRTQRPIARRAVASNS
ncbi:MAG: FkbM family methyltransferase [Candidatus Nealsonbacteria bacterium]|nr:FkbM family methyltransferase [Candidatus Nealsonbacteria bacterium]